MILVTDLFSRPSFYLLSTYLVSYPFWADEVVDNLVSIYMKIPAGFLAFEKTNAVYSNDSYETLKRNLPHNIAWNYCLKFGIQDNTVISIT